MIIERQDEYEELEMRRTHISEDAMDERRVRIRLKFQDLEILTSQQIEQGLAQSWYLVQFEDVQTIADVAYDIRAAFHLERLCPNGLSLEVDGFVLPASQPASLLKGSDLVRIKRRNNNQDMSCGQISHKSWMNHMASKELLPSAGHRLTRCHGVELRALDEFEKETGGYESEQEEGEMETDISLDGRMRTLAEATTKPVCLTEKDSGGKRRKQAKAVVSEVDKSRRTKDTESRLELALTEVKDKYNSDRLETGIVEDNKEENEAVATLSLEGKRRKKISKAAGLGSQRKQQCGAKKHKKAKDVNSEVDKSRRTKDTESRLELTLTEVSDKSRRTKDTESKLELTLTEVKDKYNSDRLETGIVEDNKEEKETVAILSLEGKRRKKISKAAGLEAAGLGSQRKQECGVKKRKKANDVNSEVQGQLPQKEECSLSRDDGMQCMDEPAKHGQHKVKRKKLNHSVAHHSSVDVNLMADKGQGRLVEPDCEDTSKEWTTTPRKKKSAMVIISNMDRKINEGGKSVLKKGKAVETIGGSKIVNDEVLDSPPEKCRTPQTNVNGGFPPVRTTKDESNETRVDVTKRPSRSARRKKAKRQWLREQAKGDDAHVSKSNKPKDQICGEELKGSSAEEVMEVEAEEELLPIVVRAGHLRFEPLDEDELADQCRPSWPMLRLGDQLKTKRQGQNWGQERSAETRHAKKWETETSVVQSPVVSGDTRCNTRSTCQIDPASFDKFPPLEGVPQETDVLAYRLLELTASWTPEISSYRVGRVAHWEHSTNVVKLDPHPDYPSFEKDISLEEDDEDLSNLQDKESMGPYDENGSLEIELGSLLEVRLIQRDLPENDKVLPSPSREIKEAVPGHQVNNSAPEPIAEVIDINASTVKCQDGEERETAEYPLAWQALVSEELERKKTELSEIDAADTNASQAVMTLSDPSIVMQNSPSNVTPGTEGGKQVIDEKTIKGHKHKYLKSAGVGTVVALLRAQQAL